MIHYDQFTLKNGLRVLLHHDQTTPLVVVNTIYNVGARDESPNQTGFAHLFEHLMFGGSINIENFDKPLQLAGGECNAFTNNDITNYYSTIPANNIETALWLESDRMLSLAFNQKSLDVQKNVVIEEFKQRYLNQPYGDLWHVFRPLIFKTHPYQWPTIGKELSHVENANIADVKAFFKKHYSPQNAILVVGGNFEQDLIKCQIEKWYGDIPPGKKYDRQILPEPIQQAERRLQIKRDVPSNAIYIAFRIGNRTSNDHYLGDLVSDILSGSKSSRLYENLVKQKKLFSQVNAYISSGFEHGLFIIAGFTQNEVDLTDAEAAIWQELNELIEGDLAPSELIKVKNKFKTAKAFQNQSLLNRVMNLSQLAILDHLDELHLENELYNQISSTDIKNFCKKYFTKTNTNALHVISSQ
ncbi:MAG: pitrilysin family protein [Putridiphycobacter sp.]|nr:pitrilysin family protein [Putridiphycobacter sp.]